ncbi:MAG: HAMP domain-containing protein [Pseudomonadales bacterium]|nr:HAMP domain-containing protein [Pseudomonadales bacterium]
MSFRLKTVLLLIVLSLTPYIITMVTIGNAYRDDFEENIRDGMVSRLNVTIEKLDQHILGLKQIIKLISSLDIMNDIVTDDIDRRISRLLRTQKQDIKLAGDFDVVNQQKIILASSDMKRVGQLSPNAGFMSIPVVSTFNTNEVGQLILRYDPMELKQLFRNEDYIRYALVLAEAPTSYQSVFESALVEKNALVTRPNIHVIVEQDRPFAFSILDDFEQIFYLATIIGIFVIATIAYLIANYIVNPIILLSNTAKSITKTQDYSQRVKMERTDEIGQLSESFNLMILGTQEMLEQLKLESENKIKLTKEHNRAEMLQDLSNKLSRYLSPQVYQSIFSGHQDVTLSSSRKKLTVFFSDIVDFTATTDHMESEDLTHILNQYLNEMTVIALRYGATVDKYIGDAIMIFFGDPESQGVELDAKRCVEMTLDMQARIVELQKEWRVSGFSKPFHVRFGMHTGYCTVGNFGSDNRMDYTIIGSTVNLASRIESSADTGAINISEETYLLVKNYFRCLPASSIIPKGFGKPVQLYRVIARADAVVPVFIEAEGFSLNFVPDQMSDSDKAALKSELSSIIDDLEKNV